MTEGFLTGLHRNWLFSSGWVFTVGGSAISLAVSGAYRWIGALVAVAGLFALTALAYQRHRALRLAEEDLRITRARAEEAERKLSQMPADMVLRMQEYLAANSFRDLVNYLLRHAEYVERMIQFAEQTTVRPPSLRTFVNQSGRLYAVARVEPAAIGRVKDGDPFILTHKDVKGLVTESARLIVHQRDEDRGVVWFGVEAFLSDEMAHLDALAATRDVAGITGYSIRPAYGVGSYANLNVANASEVIRTLADEIAQKRGVET